MAQAITSRNFQSIDAPRPDLATARLITSLASRVTEGWLEEPIPPHQLSALERRQEIVVAALQPATRSALEECVAELMTGFPSMRGLSKLEAQVLVRKYADDLDGVPLWAIRAACKDISRGAVSDMNPDFPPSAARVRQQADENLERVEREAKDLRKILRAKVLPPEHPEARERIVLGFQKLKQRLAPTYQAPPEPPPRQSMTAEQLVEHYAKHGLVFTKKPQPEE